MTHPYWPLFDLEVRTPRISLRYIDDELGAALAALAGKGIHDPSFMPFAIPWTDAASPELERNAFRYWWQCRAETTVESWCVNLAAIVDGAVAGSTGLIGDRFPTLRTFETGSWLGRQYQGQGLGKEMRIATLHLGFAGFGAVAATTGAFTDNAPSLGVTRSLGYEPNGTGTQVRRGEAAEIFKFRMTRAHWETIRRDDIELIALEPCRELLGLDVEH